MQYSNRTTTLVENECAFIHLIFEKSSIPIFTTLLYNILNSTGPFFGFSTPYWHMSIGRINGNVEFLNRDWAKKKYTKLAIKICHRIFF